MDAVKPKMIVVETQAWRRYPFCSVRLFLPLSVVIFFTSFRLFSQARCGVNIYVAQSF